MKNVHLPKNKKFNFFSKQRKAEAIWIKAYRELHDWWMFGWSEQNGAKTERQQSKMKDFHHIKWNPLSIAQKNKYKFSNWKCEKRENLIFFVFFVHHQFNTQTCINFKRNLLLQGNSLSCLSSLSLWLSAHEEKWEKMFSWILEKLVRIKAIAKSFQSWFINFFSIFSSSFNLNRVWECQ